MSATAFQRRRREAARKAASSPAEKQEVKKPGKSQKTSQKPDPEE